METGNVLYEYGMDWKKGSMRRHVDGERAFVERYIRLDELSSLFGGYMLLTDPSGATWFVGAWGRQAISRSREFSGNGALSSLSFK